MEKRQQKKENEEMLRVARQGGSLPNFFSFSLSSFSMGINRTKPSRISLLKPYALFREVGDFLESTTMRRTSQRKESKAKQRGKKSNEQKELEHKDRVL